MCKNNNHFETFLFSYVNNFSSHMYAIQLPRDKFLRKLAMVRFFFKDKRVFSIIFENTLHSYFHLVLSSIRLTKQNGKRRMNSTNRDVSIHGPLQRHVNICPLCDDNFNSISTRQLEFKVFPNMQDFSGKERIFGIVTRQWLSMQILYFCIA